MRYPMRRVPHSHPRQLHPSPFYCIRIARVPSKIIPLSMTPCTSARWSQVHLSLSHSYFAVSTRGDGTSTHLSEAGIDRWNESRRFDHRNQSTLWINYGFFQIYKTAQLYVSDIDTLSVSLHAYTCVS